MNPKTQIPPQPASSTLDSRPETQDCPVLNLPSSTEASHHRRNGNVARLPKPVRDQLNEMLLDGIPYRQIIEKLGEHGRSLSVNNISNWKTDGGFDEFLKEQQRLKECRLRQELALSLAQANVGTQTYQATPKIAVALICEALIDLGPDALRKALQDSPINCFLTLNALARLIHGGLKCERHVADEIERQVRLANEKLPQPKKGLSPEAKDEMIEKLNLM